MEDEIRVRFAESIDAIEQTGKGLAGDIARAVEVIVAAYKAGRGVFLFGNGGSAADAQHMACELTGRFLAERRALKAEALTANSSVLTAIANDYDFARVFARQIEANAGPGDVAIGFSTSGNSPSVVAGLAKGREIGMKTVALTGGGGGDCSELADVLLAVPSGCTPRIQEAHAVICHVICELVERAFVEDS